jgi:hypothetical protein
MEEKSAKNEKFNLHVRESEREREEELPLNNNPTSSS